MPFALQIDEEDEGNEMGVERFVGWNDGLYGKFSLLSFDPGYMSSNCKFGGVGNENDG